MCQLTSQEIWKLVGMKTGPLIMLLAEFVCRANPRKNPIVQEYILPDFSSNRRGRIRQPEEMVLDSYQVLYMENERFTVPEVLFNPNDIGKSRLEWLHSGADCSYRIGTSGTCVHDCTEHLPFAG